MSGYFAMCDGNHLVTKGWQGPMRISEEEAKQDAEKHRKDTYDHPVEVIYEPL